MIDFLKGRVTPQDIGIVAGIIVVVGLICAGLYFFVVMPEYDRQVELRADLQKVQADLKRAREIEEDIGRLEVETEKWENLVTQFEQRLPDEREIPRLMRRFELMGDEIGLRVELGQLPTTTDTRKETIPYEVVAYGDFHQILNFINMLERHDRYLRISELDIDEQEAGVSEASFVLSTFRFIKQDNTVDAATGTG